MVLQRKPGYHCCYLHCQIWFIKQWGVDGKQLDSNFCSFWFWFLVLKINAPGRLMMRVILRFMLSYFLLTCICKNVIAESILVLIYECNVGRIGFAGIPGTSEFWSFPCSFKLESQWHWSLLMVWCSLRCWKSTNTVSRYSFFL